MTQITSAMLADMHARRLSGESCADIARSYDLKEISVYQRLRRVYGLEVYKFTPKTKQLVAANDNYPDRTTRMSPHNGGCSTLSGPMPVTLVRIPTMDKPLLPCVAEDLQVAA